MDLNTLIIYSIIAANVLFSIQGFNNKNHEEKFLFYEGKILYGKEYYRLITSGFLHGSWIHLAFNMYTFYIFAEVVLYTLGPLKFTAIYFASLIGGNLLSLFLKRQEPHYRALGASGAVSGILYAFIAFYPQWNLQLMFIPIDIPAWIFGLGFIAFSIFGMSKQTDNIGHEAHLGGAITGLLLMLAFNPQLISQNPLMILAMLIPTLVFLMVMVKKPEILNWNQKKHWDRWDQ